MAFLLACFLFYAGIAPGEHSCADYGAPWERLGCAAFRVTAPRPAWRGATCLPFCVVTFLSKCAKIYVSHFCAFKPDFTKGGSQCIRIQADAPEGGQRTAAKNVRIYLE